MSPIRVIFLGPKGTYSHQAALQQFSNNDSEIEYIPVQSIPQCFNELERNKDISYSVVPLENSTNGQVVYSYDLLRDKMLQQDVQRVGHRIIPDLEVVGEQYVSISHCLLTSSPISSINDLSTYKNIKIYSHPQVWGQVSNYLNKLKSIYNNIQLLDANSTSNAVVLAKTEQDKLNPNDKDTIYLSIASEIAARLNQVNIIEHSINDIVGNTTRFLVLKRTGEEIETKEASSPSGSDNVSLLAFTTEQDEPGSLVDVLNILKEHCVNMTSIHSRPYNSTTSPRKWQYIFFVEYVVDKDKTNIDSFYEQFDKTCYQWCLWGTFPRDERYYQ